MYRDIYSASNVINLTTKDFGDDFTIKNARNGLMVVFFKLRGCSPCNIFNPKFETLSKEINGVTFARYEITDGRKDIILDKADRNKIKISGFPTIMLFRNGKYLMHENPFDLERLKKDINDILKSSKMY